jgi:hypothetical protein
MTKRKPKPVLTVELEKLTEHRTSHTYLATFPDGSKYSVCDYLMPQGCMYVQSWPDGTQPVPAGTATTISKALGYPK